MAQSKKYVIYIPLMDLCISFDGSLLLFDSEEEAKTFKKEFKSFFDNAPGASIIQEATSELISAQSSVISYSNIPKKVIEEEKDINDTKELTVNTGITKEQMYRLLNNELSPDVISEISPSIFARNLLKLGVIKDMKDFNYMALECIQKAFMNDDEFPIHYYKKDEKMSEAGRIVTDIGDYLTDDYIAANLLD